MSKPLFQAPILLEPFHKVDDFDCGMEILNIYLKKFALTNNQNGSSRTYVSRKENKVAGFYTLTPNSVKKESVPNRIGKGLANHPVPVILLARLAVDKTCQGQGLGRGLLKDALLRITQAVNIIGGRAILVHAKDENAKKFYESFGFEASPIDPFHLYVFIKDIRKTLGA